MGSSQLSIASGQLPVVNDQLPHIDAASPLTPASPLTIDNSQLAINKLLALDVGMKRIGVAVCDPLQLAARPLALIERRSRSADFAKLAALVKQEQVTAVICGLPINMDDSEGDWTSTVRKWGLKLAHALRGMLGQPMPVIFWDERLSTFVANQILTEQWNAGDRRWVAEDAAAAAVILQSYLDAQRQGERRDFGRIDLPARVG